MSSSDAVISLRGITKTFAAQVALEHIGVDFAPGTVHALAGMNGSGKSTLVKVLAGVHAPDAGTIEVVGRRFPALTPKLAHELGFRFIHQDPGLFSDRSVADNIAAGARFRHSSRLRVRDGAERSAARRALEELGVTHIDPRTIMRDLSPTERTMVAVARAVQDLWDGIDLRLLVLDEPTASLPEKEATRVQEIVTSIAAKGVAVVYITHDLTTLVGLAQYVTVLRDGCKVGTVESRSIDDRQLATMMAGAEQELRPVVRGPRSTEVVLDCVGLSGGRVGGIDIQLHRGEILGLAGLLGSGRSTTLRLIAGVQERSTGTVELEGAAVEAGRPRAAVERGIALVPEDRRAHAAFNGMSMADNLMMASLPTVASPFRIDRRAERDAAVRLLADYDVRPADPDKRFSLFSGGNQQKAIIARWSRTTPKVLLLDEPTQGVDVHARHQIHDAIRALSDNGMSVIVVSSDFVELAELSDRILILRQGLVKSQIVGERVDEETILHLAGTA
ncbi:monosaccharide ABC transporter ATP-binding protein, CUT2 family [Mycolicibacterium neoaurum]|uniref:sugar ABC transporter ATP-binding protein n=1 Tax=Mycolicibacterium neoaurum TaxID=1795 RepID=UPI00055A793D|nr:sugar ABC transporter ATP-binding protein [Mycolicibacterium neoaurum]SDD12193.1 monosaccharide ABC transporter ATP-binding protein, CUT2 family [Mycolicibacterium neoaurum]